MPSRLIRQNAYSSANGIYAIKDPSTLVSDHHLLIYIQHFCKNIAIFLDYMVPTPIFQRIVPAIALTQPALLHAIAACGAYTVAHSFPDFVSVDVAVGYYNKANELLLESLQEQPRNLELCTLTALSLTIFEILSNISYELRSHIMGVQALLQQFTFRKNETLETIEFGSSVSEACFYLILHMDLLTAHLLGVLPHWSPVQWGPILGLPKSPAQPSVHYWYMKVLYLVSRAQHLNHLGYDPTQTGASGQASQQVTVRRTILNDLYQWGADLPVPIKPLYDLPSNDKPFPDIFFSDPVCALAHAYYHSAILTLCNTQSGPAPNIFHGETLLDVDCNYHARRICGIVTTSMNTSVGVVTLWCFLLCAKHIYGLAERKAMISHLESIKKIGWSNKDFLSQMLASWGGPNWEQYMDEGNMSC